MNVIVALAAREEIKAVANSLRPADDQEVRTASGKEPVDSLLTGWMLSRETWCALVDGWPTVLFGVRDDPARSGVGVPWLVGTDRTRRLVRNILRLAPLWLDDWVHRWYPNGLVNVVDARNHMHIRWLVRVGCRFDQPSVIVNKHLFLPFSWRYADV